MLLAIIKVDRFSTNYCYSSYLVFVGRVKAYNNMSYFSKLSNRLSKNNYSLTNGDVTFETYDCEKNGRYL